mmetsp:Transcript_10846/g.23115  ORF Transcript_10846/g.23115 Transcript_10846/m.23115 type:complete len:111 (+) Transcript_10846:63-395(+)
MLYLLDERERERERNLGRCCVVENRERAGERLMERELESSYAGFAVALRGAWRGWTQDLRTERQKSRVRDWVKVRRSLSCEIRGNFVQHKVVCTKSGAEFGERREFFLLR